MAEGEGVKVKMVQVTTFDGEGMPHAKRRIQASKQDIHQILQEIHDPRGNGRFHVQVGSGTPVAIDFDSDELQDAVATHGQSGGVIGSLLSMIPIVGPLLSSLVGGKGIKAAKGSRAPSQWQQLLKIHMKRMKDQHPNLSHGDLMRELAKMYRAR